jgi:hypothetical protein
MELLPPNESIPRLNEKETERKEKDDQVYFVSVVRQTPRGESI